MTRAAARAKRRRLDPAARRAQLVGLGVDLLRSVPVDKIALDRVAKAAGISKGLLFHYFPTKRDYQEAVIRAAAAELLERVDVDPSLPPLERLRAGIEAFVDFVDEQPQTYVSIVRGAGSNDRLLALFEDTRRAVVDLIIEGLGIDEPPPILRIIVRGWVAMVEESTLEWLRNTPVSRDELVDMLLRSAEAVVDQAVDSRSLLRAASVSGR
ncbi:MAG: TetR/AcrR family transcriptional regulator [Acidimicrobiales bacterium]